MMAVLTITESNYQEQVLNSPVPVLLDFWASWCMPCKMMAPVVDQIAEECPDIRVGKVDVDAEGALATQFRVMSIPTLVIMENGQVTQTLVGVQTKAKLLAALEK